jgi:hypothetical protein
MKELNKLYCDTRKLSVRPVNKSIAKDIIVNKKGTIPLFEYVPFLINR